jgi:predicted DNA-binding protein
MADNPRRVNVNFSETAYRDLSSLADRQSKTKADVLRDAIALEKWFDEARREGARILVERNGEIREIIPR